MGKIILTTTASFAEAVSSSDLKVKLAERGMETILYDSFLPPFPFGVNDVFALVAGHTLKGEMLQVGRREAAIFPNLRIVSPFGIGVNHLQIPELERLGIVVKILPHFSKRTVAELTISFVLALARRLVPLTQLMQAGVWKRENAVNIAGKTLGIIGLGAIGKEVAKLGQALGMRILAYDLVYEESVWNELGVERGDQEQIIREADFLTLHLPYTSETKNLLGRAAIMKMKKGAYFINTARGGVVDESALLEALEKGNLAGAALDVFSTEPPFANEALTRLIKLPNVIATPHIGAFTQETRYQIAKYICDEIIHLTEKV